MNKEKHTHCCGQYHIEMFSQGQGKWVPYCAGIANNFRHRALAHKVIKAIKDIGGGWEACEYRVVSGQVAQDASR